MIWSMPRILPPLNAFPIACAVSINAARFATLPLMAVENWLIIAIATGNPVRMTLAIDSTNGATLIATTFATPVHAAFIRSIASLAS